MLSEINEMPQRAKEFLESSPDYSLPTGVPYIGMGSSYFAPLAFKYMGIDIKPEMASEFYNYLRPKRKVANGVLLSQSGRSTEVLWCAELFESYTAITNFIQSPLCQFDAVSNVIPLKAGEEKGSSSKTYLNTLLALFKGLGVDVNSAVMLLANNIEKYEEQGRTMAEEIAGRLKRSQLSGLYITGSGPNIGTAMQAALIMSESTKLAFQGLPMAQYDHGPKETANNSIVINILSKGKSYDRTISLAQTIRNAGATVFTIEEPEATEEESVLHNIIPFNYLSYYLAQQLNVQDTFLVGGKVTEVK